MLCKISKYRAIPFGGLNKTNISHGAKAGCLGAESNAIKAFEPDSREKALQKTYFFASNALPELFFTGRKHDTSALLGVNPKETIQDATKAETGELNSGKDAAAFDLPDNENMILRVEHKVLRVIDELPENLVVVPVKYDNEVLQMQNLGLPLYAVVENGSSASGAEYILPDKAVSECSKILLLRKMGGEHPSQSYFNSITKLIGIRCGAEDAVQQNNYKAFSKSLCGKRGIEFLESCKDGSALEAGLLDAQVFYKNYKTFTKDYLDAISKIADISQEAYNEAVNTIMSERQLGYRLDFYHPLNILVDFDKNCFNFVDVQFDPREFKYYDYRDPIEAFKKVLLGYHCTKRTDMPSQLLVYPEDKMKYEAIAEKISKKLENARSQF